jgi:hypothetical protein
MSRILRRWGDGLPPGVDVTVAFEAGGVCPGEFRRPRRLDFDVLLRIDEQAAGAAEAEKCANGLARATKAYSTPLLAKSSLHREQHLKRRGVQSFELRTIQGHVARNEHCALRSIQEFTRQEYVNRTGELDAQVTIGHQRNL